MAKLLAKVRVSSGGLPVLNQGANELPRSVHQAYYERAPALFESGALWSPYSLADAAPVPSRGGSPAPGGTARERVERARASDSYDELLELLDDVRVTVRRAAAKRLAEIGEEE